jgi:hypothetical protein
VWGKGNFSRKFGTKCPMPNYFSSGKTCEHMNPTRGGFAFRLAILSGASTQTVAIDDRSVIEWFEEVHM